jgi:hypothetical protein
MDIEMMSSPQSGVRREKDTTEDDGAISSSNDADQSESMVDTAPVSPKIRIASGRSRKAVERMRPQSPELVKKFKPAPLSGTGMKLGDISRIGEKLAKIPVKHDSLKRLHRILYGSEGTATTRKKEIRLWNGTVSEETKASMISGLAGAKSVQILKDIASILSLATGGDRATLESRICEFLLKPSGSSEPSKSSKRSSKKKSSSKKIKKSNSSSAFSRFLKTRMNELLTQSGGAMTARDITELLMFEWKNMTEDERGEFKPPSSINTKTEFVQKIIKKDPARIVENDEENASSSSSSSDSDSEDSSRRSSSSSGSSDSSSSSDDE